MGSRSWREATPRGTQSSFAAHLSVTSVDSKEMTAAISLLK
jgi:hypothetical protein